MRNKFRYPVTALQVAIVSAEYAEEAYHFGSHGVKGTVRKQIIMTLTSETLR